MIERTDDAEVALDDNTNVVLRQQANIADAVAAIVHEQNVARSQALFRRVFRVDVFADGERRVVGDFEIGDVRRADERDVASAVSVTADFVPF